MNATTMCGPLTFIKVREVQRKTQQVYVSWRFYSDGSKSSITGHRVDFLHARLRIVFIYLGLSSFGKKF